MFKGEDYVNGDIMDFKSAKTQIIRDDDLIILVVAVQFHWGFIHFDLVCVYIYMLIFGLCNTKKKSYTSFYMVY